MTVQHLLDELSYKLRTGELMPSAIVIRPLCMCDQDVGYVEAQHLDQVVRIAEPAPNVDTGVVYRYGSTMSNPNNNRFALTVKLG